MKRNSTRFLTEGGILIALATILSYLKVYEAPFGGSVTAGSMIPIIIFALRWGIMPGTLVGAVYGIIQFITDPFFFHPIQFLLDYPIAFGLLGLSGLVDFKNMNNTIGAYIFTVFGVLLAIFGRFFAHLLSGVVFFSEYAGDMNPWLYSTLYNGSYLLIEFIVSGIIIVLLWKPLKKLQN